MKIIRTLVLSFIFGGLTAIVAQAFLILWVSVLGPSIFATILTLWSLGIIGSLLVVLGVYPKLEELSGFGIGFSFGGFCAALAGIFAGNKIETGSNSQAFIAAMRVGAFVICSGIVSSFLVAMISVFAGRGGV
jgi:hypothetical protein